MIFKNGNVPVSHIRGQGKNYIYNILHDINKLKILLVFIYKGFTWYRELRNLGIYSNIIEETLNEFNSLGLIDLKELTDLDEIQYESLKSVKHDIQHYFKIYFTNPRIYEVLNEFQTDLNKIINENKQLEEFIIIIKNKLKPFILKSAQILKEERTQLTRKVNLNGVEFEKNTLLNKEIKQILQLSSTNMGKALIIKEIKPISLMTQQEINKYNNRVTYNDKEINSSIFNEIKEKDKQAIKDYENGYVGKSLVELEIERENKDQDIFNKLGIK